LFSGLFLATNLPSTWKGLEKKKIGQRFYSQQHWFELATELSPEKYNSSAKQNLKTV
jgi:hypothetical protein